MEKVVGQIALLGLLLAFVATLPKKEDWDIYSFHINSTVASRYATTVITSRVVNRMDQPKEIEFQVRIPKNAFISKFRMLIDGKMYDGVVKAKEEAQQQYQEAVSRGQSAGLVSSVGRTLEEFKTTVTIAALQKVTFELTYEELLKRRHGKYELQIHARPMQPVVDFKVDIHISEKAGISFIDVKGGLSTKSMAGAITQTVTQNEAWLYFYPTEGQQTTCTSCGEQGMNGDLVVVYDVNRDNSLGDITESDGYFVHHFAPTGLQRIPKNVVFIIDRSGSMHGRKIIQTRKALLHILGDLAEDDYFGLITFDDNVTPWKGELIQATADNLLAAKSYARTIMDRGSTDINAAVLEGVQMLNRQPREGSASLLILLTDGDPTSGVTNLEKIQSNVRKAISKRFPLYCLGFGFDVNFEFLEKMALENLGVARRIYDDSDADQQLKGFYDEVATPLLTDVMMIYIGGANLTQTNFSQYYNGSEIVVAGQITDNNISAFTVKAVAVSKNNMMEFLQENLHGESLGEISDSNIERVWAYLTVKQLLEQQVQLDGEEKEKVKHATLALSLKYSFVTPLTSMVVTKPPGEDTQVLHKPKEGAAAPPVFAAHPGHPRYHHPVGGALPGHHRHHPGAAAPPGRPYHHHPLPGAAAPPGRPYHHHPLPGAAAPPGRPYHHHPLPGCVHVFTAESLDYSDSPSAYDDSQEEPLQVMLKPTTPSNGPISHMLLLKTANHTTPLCISVTEPAKLKLLQDFNTGLSVNGELDSVNNGGFSKIVVRYKSKEHIVIDNRNVMRKVENDTGFQLGPNVFKTGSVTLIVRGKEIDISAEGIRMVILPHERQGEKFIWPALRQYQRGNKTEGLLSLYPIIYEEVHGSPTPKLRVNNKEFGVSKASAVDYSIPTAPVLDCWLTDPEDILEALQRTLFEFVIAAL
ncbi:inter-alpha-trypsin inhibitor heavy chain H3-like [Lampris incognitus]|uniref:inter-alpha-trypsin inhibitor heavy chain H3-like n=1 Tax=Lampris incognitus TaxID=2546036 RepID=UPI0024B51706|nr:inter-alpha-trypsin inhibitor heavy chain H3-like [Lampris incognitus]